VAAAVGPTALLSSVSESPGSGVDETPDTMALKPSTNVWIPSLGRRWRLSPARIAYLQGLVAEIPVTTKYSGEQQHWLRLDEHGNKSNICTCGCGTVWCFPSIVAVTSNEEVKKLDKPDTNRPGFIFSKEASTLVKQKNVLEYICQLQIATLVT